MKKKTSTGILNPANVVLDAYVAGKARYYLRRHALRTAAVLATACLLIDGLKAGAAAAARRAAASGLAPFAQIKNIAAGGGGDGGGAEQDQEEGLDKDGPRPEGTTKTGEEQPRPGGGGGGGEGGEKRARRLLRLAASGAIALGRKAVDAALPTPLLAAWLVAELML